MDIQKKKKKKNKVKKREKEKEKKRKEKKKQPSIPDPYASHVPNLSLLAQILLAQKEYPNTPNKNPFHCIPSVSNTVIPQ